MSRAWVVKIWRFRFSTKFSLQYLRRGSFDSSNQLWVIPCIQISSRAPTFQLGIPTVLVHSPSIVTPIHSRPNIFGDTPVLLDLVRSPLGNFEDSTVEVLHSRHEHGCDGINLSDGDSMLHWKDPTTLTKWIKSTVVTFGLIRGKREGGWIGYRQYVSPNTWFVISFAASEVYERWYVMLWS